jgi:hypothetical protein
MGKMRNSLIAALLLVNSLTAPALAQSVRAPVGNVIMARAGTSPLFVWNATPYVVQLGSDKLLGDPGLRALEATALSVLADKSRSLTATNVGIRVVYEKTGDVSPLYRTATFEGLEEVFTITADRKMLLASQQSFLTAVQDGKPAQGLKVDVSGALPPPY